MASGKLLRQLIRSGVEGDQNTFRRISEAVITEERQKQHNLLANDLEKILYGQDNTKSLNVIRSSNISNDIPIDKETGLPLLIIKEPVRSLEDVVLSKENSETIEHLLREYHSEELLRTWGVKPVDRILFCGLPGCGKTISAEAIARELNRSLCTIRLDSVVSSFLGETSTNLRKVFDFIESRPMVVLFDEFDALAKERADTSEHGELKRVVNAFLQMLDDYSGKSLLVAATNHEQMLDSAIWRRFDEVLLLKKPTVLQTKDLLAKKLRGVRREFEIDKSITDLFKGSSHADVERVLKRAIKSMILSGQEFLQMKHLKLAITAEKVRNRKSKQ